MNGQKSHSSYVEAQAGFRKVMGTCDNIFYFEQFDNTLLK